MLIHICGITLSTHIDAFTSMQYLALKLGTNSNNQYCNSHDSQKMHNISPRPIHSYISLETASMSLGYTNFKL